MAMSPRLPQLSIQLNGVTRLPINALFPFSNTLQSSTEFSQAIPRTTAWSLLSASVPFMDSATQPLTHLAAQWTIIPASSDRTVNLALMPTRAIAGPNVDV